MTSTINRLSRFFYHPSLGLLLVRVSVGLLFFTHGLMKVQNMQGTIGMMAHFGFPVWVAYFIAWLEVIGGLALIVGVATRLFAVLFGIEMLVATILIGFAKGISIELVLALVSFGIALTGSGKYSLYKMECSLCGGMMCSGKSCQTV